MNRLISSARVSPRFEDFSGATIHGSIGASGGESILASSAECAVTWRPREVARVVLGRQSCDLRDPKTVRISGYRFTVLLRPFMAPPRPVLGSGTDSELAADDSEYCGQSTSTTPAANVSLGPSAHSGPSLPTSRCRVPSAAGIPREASRCAPSEECTSVFQTTSPRACTTGFVGASKDATATSARTAHSRHPASASPPLPESRPAPC
jgi:hypothetical protein